MKIRYTGVRHVSVLTPVALELGPGDEFEVPDEVAETFTRRDDMEPVDKPRRRKTAETPVETAETDETEQPGDQPAEEPAADVPTVS